MLRKLKKLIHSIFYNEEYELRKVWIILEFCLALPIIVILLLYGMITTSCKNTCSDRYTRDDE